MTTEEKIRELQAENARLRAALELISKNKTDDCDIYTMGCDCDEVANKALANARQVKAVVEVGMSREGDDYWLAGGPIKMLQLGDDYKGTLIIWEGQ